jgi:hypothetical protein
MGWMRYLLLGDLGQQLDIQDQADEIARLKQHMRNPFDASPSDVNSLRTENAELRLYVAVLFRLLISKGIASEDEVRTLINRIDAADGAVDAGFKGDVVTGRPVARTGLTARGDDNPFRDLG